MTKRMIRHGLAALALASALTFTAQGTIARESQPVKIEKPQAWKGISQVVIGQFTVAFFTKKVDYDGGGFLSASDKGKATGYLRGVTNEQYQAITDAVYIDFITQLSQHGLSVADDAGFRADKYYAKIKPETQGNKVSVPLKKEDKAEALAFWPTGLGRNTNALLSMRMMDMNVVNAYTAEYMYAKSSGIPVINVIYYVDFAKPAKSDAGGLLQSMRVSAGLAVSPFGTQIAMMTPEGKMTKILLQTALEEGGVFATIDETTSGATKALHVANVLGAGLFGGSSGGMSAKFDYIVTDQAAYATGVQAATSKTSDLFLRQIESLR